MRLLRSLVGASLALAVTVMAADDSTDDSPLPTLTSSDSIPTYPAAAVPPTGDAPFMHHSHAPDGTVFIAVGAILGAMLLGVLLWRLAVGLLLHRSVRRAAMAQHHRVADPGSKSSDGLAPPAMFYKYTDQGSNMSVSNNSNGGNGNGGAHTPPHHHHGHRAAGGGGGGGGGTTGKRRTNRASVVPSSASQSNLFFSPTAAPPSGNALAGNRTSTFLPPGFYAAGIHGNNSSSNYPGSGANANAIGMSNLHPDPSFRPTPPDSPSFAPVRRESPGLPAGRRNDVSTSSVNLSNPLPPGQRAPSAYLDDLLADDPAALPPPQMPPSAGRTGPNSNMI
ncbi:hypothetical protein GMORB2_2972 [Geosmithia morbida]|uniref:Uncharacterized protein n=1 Tax=Geosmithia morbida TaxID=1094350 RepID=A0A9P4YRN3_9HYPO|nr:uncharacterized protein GMORB2_2972 [Geosmithia morbida]KAF4120534.1 hypothetical protein GMORB2_2972 [Geosmithia morbida]